MQAYKPHLSQRSKGVGKPANMIDENEDVEMDEIYHVLELGALA